MRRAVLAAAQAARGSPERDAEEVADAASQQQWFYVSDTSVRPVQEAEVLQAQAYMLLYQRVARAQEPPRGAAREA